MSCRESMTSWGRSPLTDIANILCKRERERDGGNREGVREGGKRERERGQRGGERKWREERERGRERDGERDKGCV